MGLLTHQGQLRTVLYHNQSLFHLRIRVCFRYSFKESRISADKQVIIRSFLLLYQLVFLIVLRNDSRIIGPVEKDLRLLTVAVRQIKINPAVLICLHILHSIASLPHVVDRRLFTIFLRQIYHRTIDGIRSIRSFSKR